MKKIFLPLALFCFSISLFSQIEVKSKYISVPNVSGLNNIYIFKKIVDTSGTDATEISFTPSNSSSGVKWYTFHNGIKTEITNFTKNNSTTTIVPLDNTGYIIEVDGVQVSSFWVFDYSKYKPSFNSLAAVYSDDPCENVKLDLSADIKEFYYENLSGGKQKLDRKFSLTYQNIEWEGGSWSTAKDVSSTIILPAASGIFIDAPLINTKYTITGDEYGTALDDESAIATTVDYLTKAVKCAITTETLERVEKNENERPETTSLKGSAPLDIRFYSNPTPAVNTYLWEIFKDSSPSPLVARSEKDNSYTFSEAGKYKVKLTVSNQSCSYSDTVVVEVVESSIAVPKVFTPNGDGVQDEFRVAYKSIIEFECAVFNRWGRKIFSWTDPTKGWNGKIGSSQAAIGPYYYIIKAKGSDGIKYKLKGCINLLR